jgi:hypothetical protein
MGILEFWFKKQKKKRGELMKAVAINMGGNLKYQIKSMETQD